MRSSYHALLDPVKDFLGASFGRVEDGYAVLKVVVEIVE
jgi:hypothetical protein